MALILLSLIVTVTMIVVSISLMRRRISSGSLTRSGIGKEDFSVTGADAEQAVTPGPLQQFLVVVLPDGKIVTPMVAGQV
jgi:hypothetical protein